MAKYDLFVIERRYNTNGSLRSSKREYTTTVSTVGEARNFVRNYNSNFAKQNNIVKSSIRNGYVKQNSWTEFVTCTASYKKVNN